PASPTAPTATTSRSDSPCNPGEKTCGSGTFTWSGARSLVSGSMSMVRLCGTGSGGSAIQLQAYESDGHMGYGTVRSNNNGCGTYQ
ncbi:hypothetical protein C7C46_33195, partial [Streptomyces tateyamensis]